MNQVILIGRLTRDPEVKYTTGTQKAVARFTLAIDRPVGQGKEKQTDFPSIVAFGKTAELIEKYVGKGQQVAVQGRLQTGSYTKQDGTKVYTTDVLAERVEFLGSRRDDNGSSYSSGTSSESSEVPEGFSQMDDDDLPF